MRHFIGMILCLGLCLMGKAELLQKHSSRPLQAEATLDALEPWETPIRGFFIRSHHGVPEVDLEHWTVVIDGLVDKTLKLSLKEIQKMPAETLHAVLECSGNWRGLQNPKVSGVQWGKGAVGNAQWTGVSLATLLKKTGVKPNAKFLRVEGADTPALSATPAFIRSIPLSKALEPNTLLAWKMNRETLPILHGGPLRLVLPGWYGHTWMKWVTHITLTDSEDKGFYMAKAYRMPKTQIKPGEKWDSATGVAVETLRVQSILVNPKPHEKIQKGELEFKGKAFSGSGIITKVEISTDGGKNWVLTSLEAPRNSGGWQSFEGKVMAKETGKLNLLSRATDKAGNTQPLELDWNPPGYLGNAVDQVEVEIVEKEVAQAESLLQEKCLTCHTREMVSSQRLSEEAWAKVVTKMEGFGAALDAAEKTKLVAYLSQWSPNEAKASPIPTSFWSENTLLGRTPPSGIAGRGKILFSKNCANCHGKSAEGKLAPKLTGRSLPFSYFADVVKNGKGNMPAFEDTLNRQAIADLSAFVSKESQLR